MKKHAITMRKLLAFAGFACAAVATGMFACCKCMGDGGADLVVIGKIFTSEGN